MSIQMELLLVLVIPAVLGFLYAGIWPHIRTWWYYDISKRHKEWHK